MWVNTKEYRRAAETFLKKGYYTDAPPESEEWISYWKEEQRRCIEGYSIGGKRITGNHYSYLNYHQIRLTASEQSALLKEGGVIKSEGKTTKRKIVSFPDFWDGDALFFNEFEKAKIEGQHMAVSKARRKGFSFKSSAIANSTAQFYRNSYTVIGAYLSNYLYPKGTFAMVNEHISFFNEHTAWAKNRHFVDRSDIKRFSIKEFKNGIPVEKGYKSTLSMVTFKDNAEAAVGQDNDLVILEESCKFPNLKDVFKFTEPTTSDGSYTTGMMLMFGAGGTGEASKDFEEIFYNPLFYNVRAYENIWEEGMIGSVGFFFPNFWNNPGYMDKDGNSFVTEAKNVDLKEREVKKRLGSKNDYEGFISQRCHSPAECFTILTGAIFPVDDLKKWERKIVSTPYLKHIGNNGKLINTDTEVKFEFDENLSPVEDFPLKNHASKHGCIVIYEKPKKHEGKIPNGLYIIGHDPYAHDIGASLGATYVFKKARPGEPTGDMIVASYIGRPKTMDEYNRNLFLLSKYYNAKIGFENDRGDVIGYAKKFKMLDRLASQFTLLDKTDGSTVKRGFGMHMTESRKRDGESYIADWLISKRNENDDNSVNLNMHSIYDLGLIRELIKYNKKGNFDRVVAFMVTLYHNFETSNAYLNREEDETIYNDNFFNRF